MSLQGYARPELELKRRVSAAGYRGSHEFIRGPTLVVGFDDTCDYVCDGVNDQVEINQAITDLSALGGGTVLLRRGTYDIRDQINLASYIVVTGEGYATLLRIPDAFNANLPVFYGLNISNVLISDLRIDGNRANQTVGEQYGFYFSGVTYSTIRSCRVDNMRYPAIRFLNSDHNLVEGNQLININLAAIWTLTSDYNVIVDNVLNAINDAGFLGGGSDNIFGYNEIYGAVNNWGIDYSGDGNSRNTIIGNIIHDNPGSIGIYIGSSGAGTATDNAVIGNIVENNDAGIALDVGAHRCTVTGNICRGNVYYGIWVEECNLVSITGNIVYGNGRHGIALYYSLYTTVSGNTLHNNGQSSHNIYSEIYLGRFQILVTWYYAQHCLVNGNTILCDGAVRAAYGVREDYVDNDYNNIIGNIVTGPATAPLSLQGAHTMEEHNLY